MRYWIFPAWTFDTPLVHDLLVWLGETFNAGRYGFRS